MVELAAFLIVLVIGLPLLMAIIDGVSDAFNLDPPKRVIDKPVVGLTRADWEESKTDRDNW
jgi:hypothetical protein